jgi:Microsomal signal peptidase 25 kDa subunit (SPC25)
MQLILKSSTKKHDPTYRLQVLYEAPVTGTKWEHKEIEGKFTEWFNIHGYLQKADFRRWLAKNIEVVSLADPSSTQAGEKKMGELVDESTTAASGTDVGGQTPAAKRGPGRPKKKA